jgi:iron uptake system component EfeO
MGVSQTTDLRPTAAKQYRPTSRLPSSVVQFPAFDALRWRRALTTGLSAGAVGAVLTACGSGSPAARTDPPQHEQLKVTLTDTGCSPKRLTTKAGPLTFAVVNGGTMKVSELEVRKTNGVILGEKEGLVGNRRGSFTLELGPGHYVLACPLPLGGGNGTLVVTGKPISVAAKPGTKLAAAVAGYKVYVEQQVAQLRQGTKRFTAALAAGDLGKAQRLYGPTRRHYEAIEPVAESFSSLDSDIDARINDVAPGAPWTGFHHIEQILWEKNTTKGTARLAKTLDDDVADLQRKVATLSYQPAQLANGSVELLNEVATSKITGEEDRYSHTDLSDFQGNLAGARMAFELLRPALDANGNRTLGNTIVQRFAVVQQGLDRYRRRTPLGFAYYGALTGADRLAFSQEVDALAEPLSTVAAKVSG